MLSTEALSVQIVELRGREREVVIELLTQLGELDRRKGYSELGYSSIFDYMTRKLGYSEPTASRRIGALRCLREYPELREEYRAGKLTLTAVSEASKAIQEKRIEPLAISGKSTREVRVAVAKPQDRKPPERVRPVVVKELPLLQSTGSPKPEERYQFHFSFTKEVYEDFLKVQNRLAGAEGTSIEAIFGRLIREFLREPKTRRPPSAVKGEHSSPSAPSAVSSVAPSAPIPSAPRYIPSAVKREVWNRDKGQCTFIAPDGTRCTERRYLQYDHVVPVACGGESTPSNLRLHCCCHNLLQARRVLGDAVMDKYLARRRTLGQGSDTRPSCHHRR